MNIPKERLWMYDRTHPNRGGTKLEYIRGIETFIEHASKLHPFIAEGKIRCPCNKCRRKYDYKLPDEVRGHLYKHGFKPNYWYWTDHEEVEPPFECGATSNRQNVVHEPAFKRGALGIQAMDYGDQLNRDNEMAFDVTQQDADSGYRSCHEEAPNSETQKFYDVLNELSRPLWDGCKHSPLSFAGRMISMQSDFNVPEDGMDAFMQFFSELFPSANTAPKSCDEAQKLAKRLGLDMQKTIAKYKELVAEQKKSLLEDPESGELNEIELWALAAGGPNKKGRILEPNHTKKTLGPSRLSAHTASFPSSEIGSYMTNEKHSQALGSLSSEMQQQFQQQMQQIRELLQATQNQKRSYGKEKGKCESRTPKDEDDDDYESDDYESEDEDEDDEDDEDEDEDDN